MNVADMRLLIDYNYWANGRILDAAALVTDVQLHAPMPKGFSLGSLHATLRHVLFAEWLWLRRCRDRVSHAASDFGDESVSTLESLRGRWQDEQRAMTDYVDSLADEDLAAAVEYRRADGAAFSNALAHILLQVVLHGMQHRGECAAMLTDFGRSPGNIDLIQFLRDMKR